MHQSPNYAVITGASGGIGQALAETCAAAGFTLFLVAREDATLQQTAMQLHEKYGVDIYTKTADLTDPTARQTVYTEATRHGDVTHLINNAGFGDFGAYAETDWDRQASMIELNVTAVAHLTRLFLPAMVNKNTGRILNVASTAGFLPGPMMVVYYATKNFVLSFSEGLAEELSDSAITITALCPGPTATKFEENAHLKKSKLFKRPLDTPGHVAQVGFEAMQHGKRVAVVGNSNKIFIFCSRFLPRTVIARAVARAQQKQ